MRIFLMETNTNKRIDEQIHSLLFLMFIFFIWIYCNTSSPTFLGKGYYDQLIAQFECDEIFWGKNDG